jgi:hypothetical protein
MDLIYKQIKEAADSLIRKEASMSRHLRLATMSTAGFARQE